MKSSVMSFNVRKDKSCALNLKVVAGVLLEENIIHVVVDTKILALEFSTKSEATKKYNLLKKEFELTHAPEIISCDIASSSV